MTGAFLSSIELTKLYEKTSARGTKYMVGRLGHARVTLLPGDAAEDGTPTRKLLPQAASAASSTANAARANPARRRAPARNDHAPVRPDSVPMVPDDDPGDLWQGRAAP